MSRLAQGPAPERFARIRFVPFGLLAAATLVFYGCGPNTPDGESGAVTSGSAEWPSTFAIGHDATPVQIEALDIDFVTVIGMTLMTFRSCWRGGRPSASLLVSTGAIARTLLCASSTSRCLRPSVCRRAPSVMLSSPCEGS